MEQDSDRNVKPNKVEKVLAESKSNPAIDKTIKLKKKKEKEKKDSPGKQKTAKILSLKEDVSTFREVKFGTCDTLNERNTLLTCKSKGRCQMEEASAMEDNGQKFNSAETRVHNVLENKTHHQINAKRLLSQLFSPSNAPAVSQSCDVSVRNQWDDQE